MNKRQWLVWVVLGVLGWWLCLKVQIPPSYEQLSIWLGNVNYLRIVCFLGLFLFVWVWSQFINKTESKHKTGFWFGCVILISPFLFEVWASRPLELLKLISFTGAFLLIRKIKNIFVQVLFLSIFVLGINTAIGKQLPSIIRNNNFNELQRQVTEKITREDTLTDRIELPLLMRRVPYNKYSILARNILKSTIDYWKLDDIFFIEVHPKNLKGQVVYFWPSIVLLLVGLYWLAISKNSELKKVMLVLILVAIVDFVLTDKPGSYRYILSVIPITWVIGLGLYKLRKNFFGWTMILLVIYGYQAHFYDFAARKDYWIDNKSLLYQDIYKRILPYLDNNKIVISDRIGGAKLYCDYYLKDKCSQNFVFNGFELSKEHFETGDIYVGFIGEFVGNKFKNDFSDNDLEKLEKVKMLDYWKIRDSVAYGYGEILLIGEME